MVDADIVAAAAAVVDAAACFPCCPSQKKGVKVKGASSRAGKGKGRARQRLSEHKVREQHLGGNKLQTSSKSSRGPRRGVRLQIPIGKL